MRSRRPRTALVLVAMAIVLLGAIALGQHLGDRALLSATQQRIPIASPLATPVSQDSANPAERNWKRLQVVSVATDPAFPDPRVTRPPTPRPPDPLPPPKPRLTPTPKPTATPDEFYTSPPLPVPIASHDAEESPAPSATGTIPP